MKDLFIIKDRLNEAIRLRNLTAAELSRKSGIDKSSLSRYLTGETIPRTNAISKLAETLNINPAWLIGYDVPMVEEQDLIARYKNATMIFEKLNDENKEQLLNFAEYLMRKQEETKDEADI